MIEWISVKDRRPKYGEIVLGHFVPSNTPRLLLLHPTGEQDHYWEDANEDVTVDFTDSEGSYVISHWAEIQPPERPLKECPFCHNKHITYQYKSDSGYMYCGSCYMTGPKAYTSDDTDGYGLEKLATELWNKR